MDVLLYVEVDWIYVDRFELCIWSKLTKINKNQKPECRLHDGATYDVQGTPTFSGLQQSACDMGRRSIQQ